MTLAHDPSARVSEGYVAVPGAQLYYREVGNGHPIIVVHGGPDFNHNYLLPELDRLANAHRLIYYDQRGRGKSSAGVAPEDVGIESEIDDLERLRRHFDLERIALLGHSWGALIAMEYAIRHPDRVSHLVLLNAAPASYGDRLRFREQREVADAASLAKMRAIAARPKYARGDVETDAEYYRAHFSRALYLADQIETIVRRLRVQFAPADIVKARAIEDRLYAQTAREGTDSCLLARFARMSAPTLVIHGDHDLIPLQCAKNVADAVRGARLVVLRDCGHFSYLERPTEVFDAILGCIPRR